MTAMNNQKKCDTCGAPLQSVDELCSHCLLQAGIDETVVLPELQMEEKTSNPGNDAQEERTWDYEILEEIAQGGMGVVYKSRQKKLNRVVALKMLLAGAFVRQDVLKRFLSEAEVVAHLDHPNIVPIYEIGRHDGQTFFTMKYIENGTLKESLPALMAHPRRAVELMVKVIRAVHFAHQRGVLHRDIKPGNILIDAQGEPWVTDFGLAKREGEDVTLTRTGTIMGTPAYMAPEQAKSGRVPLTVSADVYSLGAVLYHLFTGRPPFDAQDSLEVLQSVQSDEPKHPNHLNPSLPEDLSTICLKCLEKHPSRRYASAEALCQDLERWLDYQPIEARPSGFWERRVKWARRKPAIAVLSLLVVFLSVFGVGGFFLQTMQKQQALEQAHQAAMELAMARAPKLSARKIMLHEDRAASVVFNKDGSRLLSSSKDQRARIWDPYTGELLLELDGSEGALSQAKFSPDESKILTVSVDEGFYYSHLDPAGLPTASFEGPWNGETKVRIWDAQSGGILHVLDGHQAQVVDADFSPDGQWVVSGSLDKQAIIWNAETGQLVHVLAGHKASVASVGFTPDGRFAVTTSLGKYLDIQVKEGPDNNVSQSANTLTEPEEALAYFWDVQSGKRVRRLPNQVSKMIGGTEVFYSSRCNIIISQDGRYAVTAAELPGNTCLWDLDTFELVSTLSGHQHTALDAAFSPDGKWLATACADHMVRMFRVSNSSLVHELKAHQAPVLGVSFSSDDQRLLSVSADGSGKIWDVDTGFLQASLEGHQDRVVDGVFHPDGFHIATASRDHTIRIWESGTLEDMVQVFKGHRNGIVDLDWHPGGKYLVSAANDRTARVWSLEQPESSWLLKVLGPAEEGAYSRLLGNVRSVCFSPDGSAVWTGAEDADGSYQKKVGPVSVGKPVPLPFTPARMWDWKEQTEDWGITGLPSGVAGVFPDRSGRFVMIVPDGQYVDAGVVDSDGVHSISGRKVSKISPIPFLYDVSKRRRVMEFPLVQQVADHVDFSPDGVLVAFRGGNQPLRIFRVNDGTLVQEWGEGVSGNFLFFTEDSKHVFMAAHSMKLGIWDIESGHALVEMSSFSGPLIGAWLQEEKNQILTLTHQGKLSSWDLMTGDTLSIFKLESPEPGEEVDYRVARLSSNGRLLALVPHRNRQFLEVWDVRKQERLVGLRAHQLPISALVFSPDNHWLAAGSNDATVKAWPVGVFVQTKN